jgi:phage baseplate assembly protein W
MALKLDILRDAKNTDSFRKYSYADLHLDIELSSHTSDTPTGATKNAQDLKLSYDEDAIYNSIRNIFNTKKGQKILSPTFGLDLEQYLFENISKENGELIGTTIFEELSLYEPRIIVDNVDIVARPDQNEYKISISITIPSLNNKKGTASGLLTVTGFRYS